MAEKPTRTDRSDTEMDTEAGGEAGTSPSHSRHKTTYFQTDPDEKIQHNISGLSSFFGNLQSVTRRLSSNHHHITRTLAAASPTSASPGVICHQQQPQNYCTCLQSVLFRSIAVKHLQVLFRTTQIFQKQFISCKTTPNTLPQNTKMSE